MADYGPQLRHRQYTRGLPKSIQFQEHPKSVTLPGKIAAGMWTPYAIVEGMAKGVIESAEQFRDWLETDMYRPVTPESTVRAAERMIDIGTPGTSGAKTAGSTLGIFGGRGAKVKPPMGMKWVNTDKGVWESFGKMDEWGIPQREYAIMQGSYKGKTGYHLYDAESKHTGSFKTLKEAKESFDQGFRWFQNPYDKKWRFEKDAKPPDEAITRY